MVKQMLAQQLRADRSFERLYRRHVGGVYRFALAMLSHPVEAESVTTTAFLNAYGPYRRGESPSPHDLWLTAIVHRICRHREGDEPFRLDDGMLVAGLVDEADAVVSRRAVRVLADVQVPASLLQPVR
jgi:DNA-directed RNA polymerase specialized sigma24 family protein